VDRLKTVSEALSVTLEKYFGGLNFTSHLGKRNGKKGHDTLP
jgi:hypothetical protein